MSRVSRLYSISSVLDVHLRALSKETGVPMSRLIDQAVTKMLEDMPVNTNTNSKLAIESGGVICSYADIDLNDKDHYFMLYSKISGNGINAKLWDVYKHENIKLGDSDE